MSKIWEWIKDLVGILDDAGDYIDRVKDEMESINPVVTQLNQETGKIKQTLEMIRHSQDAELIKDLFTRLDLDRPFLFGKAIGKKLVNAQKELQSLKSHLAGQKDRVIAKVAMPVVDQAINRLDRVFREHGDMLKQISTLQMQRKVAIREVLNKIAKGGAMAAGVSFIAISASMMGSLVTLAGTAGMFQGTVTSFMQAITKEWLGTERVLRGVNDLRRAEQNAAEDRLAASEREASIARNELRRRGGDAGQDF